MNINYNLKVLLWCTFIFVVIILLYIGATHTLKESMTVMEFNNDKKQKRQKEQQYLHNPYDYWATPRHPPAVSQTTNMFSTPPTAFLPLGGEVYNNNPFLSTSPPCTNTHFGPTIMDPTFIQ